MKLPLPLPLPLVVQQMQSLKGSASGGFSPFWLLIHFLCCLGSTVLGFRFSRLLFFLFFSSSPLFSQPHLSTITTTTTTTTITTITTTFSSSSSFPSNSSSLPPPLNTTFSHPVTTRPVVGRHGIRVRPWPHPDPLQLMRAHQIIRQVQLEQRKVFSANNPNPKPILVVTPTYVRAAQALHLTALAHTLRLLPYHVSWLVIEAAGVTNVTASILARSSLPFFHLAFADSMPHTFQARRVVQDRMRLHALRFISEQKMEGVVVFADESNIHDLKLFDEAQKVKSVGAINLSFLTDPRNPNQENNPQLQPVVQGPLCNSDGQLSGWRTLDSTNDAFAPQNMEWAGFLLDSKWLLEKDLDKIDANLKGLLGDNGSGIEPLGKCAHNVLVWWIRAETQPDTKFPPGWAIEQGIPSKHETNSTSKRR
ncbi:Glycosyltransferase [Rhynchospora pubera]|uniref:Glycosyltransferases n=1 Tax=Rhynchospora pubera TaxID=906938 RepID=A0AAV8H7J8_9POAL|nr:Glycosyltransferase [Rhynchospora pubera]